ncbi:hypothetical protein Hdeb2414_s0027g00690211 [Helianthus debilis subsp. tardiflorus]
MIPRRLASCQIGRTVPRLWARPCSAPRSTKSTSQPKNSQQNSTICEGTVVHTQAHPCIAKRQSHRSFENIQEVLKKVRHSCAPLGIAVRIKKKKLGKLLDSTRMTPVQNLLGHLSMHIRACPCTPVPETKSQPNVPGSEKMDNQLSGPSTRHGHASSGTPVLPCTQPAYK